jgi:hypothetical protein
VILLLLEIESINCFALMASENEKDEDKDESSEGEEEEYDKCCVCKKELETCNAYFTCNSTDCGGTSM